MRLNKSILDCNLWTRIFPEMGFVQEKKFILAKSNDKITLKRPIFPKYGAITVEPLWFSNFMHKILKN